MIMNNVVVRSLSGIVYVALIVGAILCGDWAFYALTAVFAVLGMSEFDRMSHTPDDTDDPSGIVSGIDMGFALVIVLSAAIPALGYGHVAFRATVAILALYMIVRMVVALNDLRPHAYREMAKSVLGVMYIALPMYLLNMLYSWQGEMTHMLVLNMFIMIWLNDTGAFCFGSLLGKHRLCERLSPKKSWEGFWGGLLCCVVYGWVCYQWLGLQLSLPVCLIMGVVVSVCATLGDLFESMLKRTVHVKDSGALIPGHGGILDRIDSLLMVAPAMFVLFTAVFASAL